LRSPSRNFANSSGSSPIALILAASNLGKRPMLSHTFSHFGTAAIVHAKGRPAIPKLARPERIGRGLAGSAALTCGKAARP
jgi:hypothetical protein